MAWEAETNYLYGGLVKDLLSESQFDTSAQKFMDVNTLKRTVVPETIGKILPSHEGEDVSARKSLIDYICTSAPKIFAISIRIGFRGEDLYHLMQLFQENNFKDDTGLPIAHPLDQHADQNRRLASRDMRVWSQHHAIDFYDRQFMFLAPVLKVQDEVQTLPKQCPCLSLL